MTTDTTTTVAPAAERVLDARGVTMRFGGLTAVRNVDLHVNAGEIVGLIGPNGAGKTTFFNCLTGLYIPTEGEVRYKDTVLPPKSFKVTAAGIARTFQNIRLFANMTVLEKRAGRPPHPDEGRFLVRDPARPRLPQGRSRLPRPRHGTPRVRRTGEEGRPPLPQPPLRRAAQARNRPRTRQRARPAPPRRAHRRHEPAGDASHRGTRLRHPRQGHRRPRHRARHALHLQPLRPRRRPRPGREARRGRQRHRPGRRACRRRLPRRTLRRRPRQRRDREVEAAEANADTPADTEAPTDADTPADAETTTDAAPGKENDR